MTTDCTVCKLASSSILLHPEDRPLVPPSDHAIQGTLARRYAASNESYSGTKICRQL